MQSFPIIVPQPPSDRDKQLNKLHATLAKDAASLLNRRKLATDEWFSRSRRIGLLAQSIEPKDRIERAAMMVINHETEISILSEELLVMGRIISDYLTRVVESYDHEVRVAEAFIDLAKEHELKIFQRDRDPDAWPVDAGILDRYISTLPTVVSARLRFEEMRASNTHKQFLEQMRDSLRNASARLALLEVELTNYKRYAERIKTECETAATELEAKRTAGLEHQRKMENLRDEATADARSRLKRYLN